MRQSDAASSGNYESIFFLMTEHFRRHAKALPATLTVVASVTGFIAAIAGQIWISNNLLLVMMNSVYLLSIGHLIVHIYGHKCEDLLRLPKVRSILEEQEIVVVETSPWLGIGVMISVYILNNDVERLLCVGEVINIQHNSLVQILVREHSESPGQGNNMWKILGETDKEYILIKPGIYLGSV